MAVFGKFHGKIRLMTGSTGIAAAAAGAALLLCACGKEDPRAKASSPPVAAAPKAAGRISLTYYTLDG